jgi:hypothetical protein
MTVVSSPSPNFTRLTMGSTTRKVGRRQDSDGRRHPVMQGEPHSLRPRLQTLRELVSKGLGTFRRRDFDAAAQRSRSALRESRRAQPFRQPVARPVQLYRPRNETLHEPNAACLPFLESLDDLSTHSVPPERRGFRGQPNRPLKSVRNQAPFAAVPPGPRGFVATDETLSAPERDPDVAGR